MNFFDCFGFGDAVQKHGLRKFVPYFVLLFLLVISIFGMHLLISYLWK